MQVNCFEEYDSHTLVVGTSQGLYQIAHNGHKLFKPVILKAGMECNSMYKDRKGMIWIGTSDGLYRMTPEAVITKVFSEPVNCLYSGDDQALYVGTATQGIWQVTPTEAVVVITELTKEISNVKQILTYNGQFMGLSQSGPFLLDKDTSHPEFPLGKAVQRFPMFQYVNHKYTCLLNDSDNDLWLGTYDGLTLWSTQEQKLYTIHTDQGLVNNSIKAIIEDQDHSFWVTTSMGISHLYKKAVDSGYVFEIQNFNTYNGLIDHAFAERAVFLTSAGVLYAGGIEGMNMLPTSKKNDQLNLHPILLSLKIFGKSKDLGIQELGITYTNSVELRYNQNFFTISFSGLNYINPLQTYYRFKLEGIDEDWREKKTMLGNGEANYTGIPPGDYNFHLQASADGMNWSDTTDSLHLYIAPPFWKTPWAYTAYVLLGGLVIMVTVVYFNKKMALRRQHAQNHAIEVAKSEFITNISHELRTPLTLVITPLRALILKINDLVLKKELLQINNNAQLLLDVVNQLLAFKKLDSGKETLQLQFYENLLCIEELAEQYRDFALQKGISFKIDVSQEAIAIFIDRQKVCRIVANLLSNALKYTSSGGQITVKAIVDKGQKLLTMEVSDTGIGIDANEQQKIFDRFYQAKNQKGSLPGSGLGLFMVKEYALLHHGTIHIKSVVGKGTTFTVTLSVGQEAPKHYLSEKEAVANETLLIADDNAGFRDYLKSELGMHYNVIVCCNGQEALEQTLLHSPDLVISDVMMPELTGAEFCKSLRNEVSISHIPVILLTGRTSDQARLEGYESGADAYLVKPFDIQVLRMRIEKLLELTRSRRKAFVEATIVETDRVATNSLDKSILNRALVHVYHNLKNPDYSVEKFSSDMFMDRTGLYRKLIALTGLSPTAFIRNIRLKKAAELLLQTSTSITAIAEETGFNSVSYFTKCFHEVYSKTPSQFRAERVS
ncbi:hybrid sensor histidine kinase/response regulator transcription factor [Neptunitalea chrysea]|nr:ATP-binding protein [Neptunitalea chrysea]